MSSGEFVINEEQVTGLNFNGYPSEVTALVIYRVVAGKIEKMMLLI
jgi:hypothetical protein